MLENYEGYQILYVAVLCICWHLYARVAVGSLYCLSGDNLTHV